MSFWCAWVGEIIIKSEFRADFGYLFRGEYDSLESGPIADYVKDLKELKLDMLPLFNWNHMDYEDRWKGKYKTSYDEETGFFTYGVAFNRYGCYRNSIQDMFDLLEKITEEKISEDSWYEDLGWLRQTAVHSEKKD